MATDVGSGVKLVFLPLNRKDELRKIWHLDHLSIATSQAGIWIKGFESDDLLVARLLVDATFYTATDGFLYLSGNKVPERSEPKGLLWSNIQKLIHLELPSFNENLFDVNGRLNVELSPISEKIEVAASIVNFIDLRTFIDETPDYIFDSCKWCLLNENQCFILGKFVFSIESKRFWSHQQLLIPVGYDFTSELLRSSLKSVLEKEEQHYFVFDKTGGYFELPMDKLQQLSRSSVKLTHSKLPTTP